MRRSTPGLDQRQQALRRAWEIRERRTERLREIRDMPRPEGVAVVLDILTHEIPPEFRSLDVVILLRCVYGVREVHSERIVRHAGLPVNVKLGELSIAQRHMFAEHVRNRWPEE